MSLSKYKQKRNFSETDEPSGSVKKSQRALLFVVQKHAASHLHYDFRLEMEGVLKSWAVPKGPSMNPADKRLAMMVEDHPYDYKDFEGTIPAGNYGAGQVIVWDNGDYTEAETADRKEAEKKLLAGLRKGHLNILLNGKKLKGKFSLIKMHGRGENSWLLVKKEDDYSTDEDITKKDKSVISKKTLEDIGAKKKTEKVKKNKADTPAKKTALEKKTVKKKIIDPDDYKVMLSNVREEPFDNEDWVFEIKHDGYRALAFVQDGEVELISRNNLSFNKQFAPVVESLKKMKHNAVLDGEVVIEDAKGISRFQLLQNTLNKNDSVLKYYVFDILNLDGNDIRTLTLLERKEMLRLLLEKEKPVNVFYSDHIEKTGKAFFELASQRGLEGIMAKDRNSPYRSGKRSSEWLKIKITHEEEAVIAGFTAPKGGRHFFGSLILGMYKGKTLHYVGNCGTGFTEATLKDLYNKFKSHFADTSPFKEKIKIPGLQQWLKPELVCQVKFTEMTTDGILRHPVFLGLRVDKQGSEVQQQLPEKKTMKTKVKSSDKPLKTIGEKNPNEYDLKIGKVILHLTNQNKIYFPGEGITKGDIVNYYREMADVILPYLRNRPQSMNRFPNGINAPGFYQKDVDIAKSPEWITTEKIFSDSNKEYIDYLICNDKATLIYMANLGCIEVNPWNSQITHPENPDWCVIDLDPEKIAFKEVVRTALEVKKLLDEWDLQGYCKTSGATGLHIFIPLAGKYNYDIVKMFAELIATTVNERIPAITSVLRSPAKRQGKVYLDFLQNRRGQTLACPYSARPKPHATVSTPLLWKELNDRLDPVQFTIRTIQKRLDKVGDLWKPVIGKGVNIDKVLHRVMGQ